MEYLSRSNRVLLSLAVVALTLFLFLSSFYLFLYNPRFYDNQYVHNGVYDALGYEQTWEMTRLLWAYMKDGGELSSQCYSERDILHMIDVRNILLFVEALYFAVSLTFILLVFYFFTFNKKDFKFFLYDLFFSTCMFCFLLLVFFVFLSFFFTESFTIFHRFAFTNDYWLMDPATDQLIHLFPEQFFLTFFLSVLGVTLLFLVVLFGLSIYIKKRYL